MGKRDEDDYTSANVDGSQTERARGTFGGRQRWISPTNGTSNESISRSNNTKRISAPAVHSFLSSVGIGAGDEMKMIKREADDVAVMRREYDGLKCATQKQEKEIMKLKEQLSELNTAHDSKKADGIHAKGNAMKLENQADLIDTKLENELADKGVYKHMIQRLTAEVQQAKKQIAEKESELAALENDSSTNAANLLTARQEKALADQQLQKIETELIEKKDENARALNDLQTALSQTKQKVKILELREISRKRMTKTGRGELSHEESKKLKQEKFIHQAMYSEVQKGLQKTDERLQTLESDLHRVSEAAGTTDIDKIIAKYLSREETFQALKKEYGDAEIRMKQLSDKNTQFKLDLHDIQGSVTNTRGIYQEMDDRAEKLKELEKDSALMLEKYNRINVVLDCFRSCMQKSLVKLGTVKGVIEFGEKQDDAHAANAATSDLVHIVEQKLNRVIEKINREKAEHEHQRADGLRRQETTDMTSNRSSEMSMSETEEHFILRMTKEDTSPGNIRVRPTSKNNKRDKVKWQGQNADGDTRYIDENYANNGMTDSHIEMSATQEEDIVIDRSTRKKLSGLVINRGKKTKKIYN